MSIDGFKKEDFAIFTINGLENRMQAIQNEIQPKFKEIGAILEDDLSAMVGSEMHLHIAKHARRTVNPPNDTWLAIAGNKRGYKKHPHFQLGMWDDHLFIWLAFIYELPNKTAIAQNFAQHKDLITQLPDDFVISLDHMQKNATAIKDIDLDSALTRFHDIKKAEFLIGKQLKPNNKIVQDGNALIEFTKETFEKLIPLYRLSFQYH